MKPVVEPIKSSIRYLLRQVAIWLDKLSNGRLTPNAVTVFGLLMHLPIAIMIARGRFVLAAVLLVIFGLFDTLDGELARVQKRTSDVGGLLDAATDRFKEVMLYAGAAFFLAGGEHPQSAVWAVVACGAALSVSYIKSKGETMVAARGKQLPYSTLNRMFSDGVLPFEMRMFVLLVGLLTGQLLIAVAGIAILATLTAFQRLATIASKLK
ncbi:MAG: CDP-alcohol phosphatidyltransferase family protein [Candidatus Saccharimonadales bacterium]